jgi:hypothetical protein
LRLAPRHQDKFMPVLGEDARERRADTGRGAGD